MAVKNAKPPVKALAKANVSHDEAAIATRTPGKLMMAAIKTLVVAGLVRDKGVSRPKARRMAEDIDEELVMELMDHVGAAAIGDGAFLDWLANGGLEKILAMVKMIIDLFMGMASVNVSVLGRITAAACFLLLMFTGSVHGESRRPMPLETPVVVGLETPVALTYADGHALALESGKPLIVWVGGEFCPECVKDSASEFVHVFVETYEGVSAPAVVVAVVDGKELIRAGVNDWWIVGDREFGHVPTIRSTIRAWLARREAIRAARFTPLATYANAGAYSSGMSYGTSYSTGMSYQSSSYSSQRMSVAPLVRRIRLSSGCASGRCGS